MANVELVLNVKKIVSLVRSGHLSEAYLAYRDLFGSPAFPTYTPEDQRQTLRLMIYVTGAPTPPTPEMIDAHRAAVGPLTELVSKYKEPVDHEMLGMCYVILDKAETADAVFRAGLAIERERDPQSALCGAFIKRISLL